MLLVKICPKCGRRYPGTMKTCLECGTRLVEKGSGERKKEVAAVARYLGIIAAIGVVLCVIWFFVLPLLQYSMVSGRDFSTIIKADAADQSAALPHYAMNQKIHNDIIEISVTGVREGTNVLNANRFYYVTVLLRNMKQGGHVQVAGSDFILIDAKGNAYYTYGIGNKVAQDLGPLEEESFELNYEIPREATGMYLHFYFPGTDTDLASSTPVVFTLA